MCEIELPAKSDAICEPASQTVHCSTCVSASEVVAEEPRSAPVELPREVTTRVPGASARRKYERREARRQDRIRSSEHRQLGEPILAMSEDPQLTGACSRSASSFHSEARQEHRGLDDDALCEIGRTVELGLVRLVDEAIQGIAHP
jgi:hypothetical protein